MNTFFCIVYLFLIAAVDLKKQMIPDCLTVSLLCTELCRFAGITQGSAIFAEHAFGGITLLLAGFFAYRISKKGLGQGDVKLMGVIGFSAGIQKAVLSVLCGAIFGIAYFCFCPKKCIPFAPFVFAGFLSVFLAGAVYAKL